MSKVIFDGVAHFKGLVLYYRKKLEWAEKEAARLEALKQEEASSQREQADAPWACDECNHYPNLAKSDVCENCGAAHH